MKKWFFDSEGKISFIITILGDHFVLSILWLACALPVVTAGAASAAMCSMSQKILDGEDCHLVRDFFRGCKEYFKPATKLWAGILAVGLLFGVDIWFYLQVAEQNDLLAGCVLGMIGLIGLLLLICLVWIYPYTTRHNGGMLHGVKMAFLLGVLNLGHSVVMLVLDAAVVVVSIYVTFLVPFVPGIITLINSFGTRLVFDTNS